MSPKDKPNYSRFESSLDAVWALPCNSKSVDILAKAGVMAEQLIDVGDVILPAGLEAQQRYFSYRAILAAIVSQNYFVLVFVGYRTIIARYVAKWGIAQMCLCETKYQGGGIAPFRGSANLLEEVSRDMGYRSDSIAISRDTGPLSQQAFQVLT